MPKQTSKESLNLGFNFHFYTFFSFSEIQIDVLGSVHNFFICIWYDVSNRIKIVMNT